MHTLQSSLWIVSLWIVFIDENSILRHYYSATFELSHLQIERRSGNALYYLYTYTLRSDKYICLTHFVLDRDGNIPLFPP